MKTRLLMVRHATCAHIDDTLLGRAVDAPLDAHGKQQVRALAARLRDEAPSRIECSPRRRTLQTACAIAAATGCDMQVTAALDELDFGEWAGHTFAQLEQDQRWCAWNHDRDHARTPAGIDIQTVQSRLDQYLAALSEACAGATLVLVTHAEIIRSIVLRCLGASANDYPRVVIDPASITQLWSDAKGMHLQSINEPALP
ncbi:MAG TPA: histidine phosphatase family protein [Rhodanobacteraceae bacterium]